MQHLQLQVFSSSRECEIARVILGASQTAGPCKFQTMSFPTYRFFRRLYQVRTVRRLKHARCTLPWVIDTTFFAALIADSAFPLDVR